MNLNEEKLNRVFHDVLTIIAELKEIDEQCKKQKCPFRKSKIHGLLLEVQKELTNLREDILEAIEIEDEE